MEAPQLLVEVLLLIAVATAGVALFERLRLPAIAGFLVMGALVGPGGLRLVDDPERVQALAELGVVFLLFEIGLELPLERLRRLWRRALLAGGLQLTITIALVAGVGTALGLGIRPALILGGLVAMSSTALVLRLLSGRGEIDAPQGQIAVGILLFQDLCIVPLLLSLPILAASDPGAAAEAALAVLQSIGALGLFFVVARFALPWMLDRAARLGSRDLFSLLAFLVVVGSAVAAHAIGLTLAIGAFFGGLVLSASPYAHQLFAEIVPLRGVLLGLFFTAVGMLVDPSVALREWDAVAGYVVGVIALKTTVVAAIVLLVLRQSGRVALLTGTALAQTGEFSFVLAAAAAAAGLLDAELSQIFVSGSVLTLIATPFLLSWVPRIVMRETADGRQASADGGAGAADREGALRDHAVLIGYGLAGQQLARVLRGARIEWVAVESNATTVREARKRGDPVLFGDATRQEILLNLGVDRARLVIVAISDPLATRRAVTLARRMAPDATIAARTRYMLEVDDLDAAGADQVVAEELEGTIELAVIGLRRYGVPEGGIARFAAELREAGYTPLRGSPQVILDPWLTELLEQDASDWVELPGEFAGEHSLAELGLRDRTGASVLAVDRGGNTVQNPPASYSIRGGDRLLVFGTPQQILRLRALLGVDASD